MSPRSRYARDWHCLAATIVFLLVWQFSVKHLAKQVHWPEAYDLHYRGRGAFYQYLFHSDMLLRHGGLSEAILFFVMWLVPAWFIGVAVWLNRRRSR